MKVLSEMSTRKANYTCSVIFYDSVSGHFISSLAGDISLLTKIMLTIEKTNPELTSALRTIGSVVLFGLN